MNKTIPQSIFLKELNLENKILIIKPNKIVEQRVRIFNSDYFTLKVEIEESVEDLVYNFNFGNKLKITYRISNRDTFVFSEKQAEEYIMRYIKQYVNDNFIILNKQECCEETINTLYG